MLLAVDERLPNREKNLLLAAHQLTSHSHRDIASTARRLLGQVESKIQPIYNSQLNNDGSPLQLCITAAQQGQSLRILGDPSSDIVDTKIRHSKALLALHNIMNASADASLNRAIETTLDSNLPRDTKSYHALRRGTMWLGAPIGAMGIAVYLNGRWGTASQQWERVIQWLNKSIPVHASRVAALAKLRNCAVVASMGLEGSDDKNLRYKIYFRLSGTVDLAELGIDLLQSEPILKFLELTLADHEISRHGVVFCIGLSAATGEIVDAKIDLCGHCLAPVVDDWTALMETLTYQINLPLQNTLKLAVQQQFADIAFLGCGVKNDGSVRLNLYLKGRE